MNGKQAKRLRRLAATLKLDPKTSYQPVGPEVYVEAKKAHGREYTAGIKRRPLALGPCQRRVYQEAKLLYSGKVPMETGPAEEINPMDGQRAFRDRMVDSIKKQGNDAV
jgi:hypothetical protein